MLDPMRPQIALHIGNFVGISLAYLTCFLAEQHCDSLVVGVDPDVPHRGIRHPQEHVAALLTACGLENNVC